MANVKTISFGPGQSNADLQAQQMQLQRQQKLADLLRQQALTPQDTQVVSGVAVKNSPWTGATQLAKAFLANRMDNDADTKQSEIGNQLAQRQAAALKSLAPAGVFDDAPSQTQAPAQLSDQPKASMPGQMPVAQQQIDPALRERWARAIATYQANPELGGKLIQDLSKEPEFSTTPQYDQQGNAFVLNSRGERKDLPGTKARDKFENVNGVWQNPYAQQEGAFAPQDPNAPFMNSPDGPVANQAYQDYQMRKARAGATNISTKTEVKAAESIAGQVGPMLKESASAAEGAAAQVDAADRIIRAVKTDKIFAGPLASKRLSLAQLGQVLGIGGESDAEIIANTRQVVRGLSEMTLAGRKEMAGQGAVTDKESALAERAASGDIDSLTPAEILIIANASKRVGDHRLKSHQRKVEKARNNPATSGIADYFDVVPMQPQAAPPVNTSGFRVIR